MHRRPLFIVAGLAFAVLGVAAVRSVTPHAPPRPSDRTQSENVNAAVPTGSEPPVARAAFAPTTPTAIAPTTQTAAEQAPEADARDGASSPRTTETLLAELRSSDDFVVLEAARALVDRKATAAIPELVAIDIRRGPQAAPNVIDALGRLAVVADPAAKRTATDRLLHLLAQERARDARESAGNVLTIYEALGRTLEPRAAPALEAELLDPAVTLAAKTVVVEALVQLRQPSSAAPLRTLQQELGPRIPADNLEAEVQRELAASVEKALQVLR